MLWVAAVERFDSLAISQNYFHPMYWISRIIFKLLGNGTAMMGIQSTTLRIAYGHIPHIYTSPLTTHPPSPTRTPSPRPRGPPGQQACPASSCP